MHVGVAFDPYALMMRVIPKDLELHVLHHQLRPHQKPVGWTA